MCLSKQAVCLSEQAVCLSEQAVCLFECVCLSEQMLVLDRVARVLELNLDTCVRFLTLVLDLQY